MEKKRKHELKYLLISLFFYILEHFTSSVCQTAARRQRSDGGFGYRAENKGEKMLRVVRVKYATLRGEFCLGREN